MFNIAFFGAGSPYTDFSTITLELTSATLCDRTLSARPLKY